MRERDDMADRSRPRRPASLDPQQAELIEGDDDPAESSELAHGTAQAIIGQPEAPPEIAARIRETVVSEGFDTVAALWSRSPATTLPGTLWRLYLLHEWIGRDPQTVEARFEDGAPDGVMTPGELADELTGLFAGQRPDALADTCRDAAAFLTVLVRGAVSSLAPSTGHDEATSTEALTATAAELHEAADLVRRGDLE